MNALVRRAALVDLDELVPLFDGYRRFYGRSSDEPLARAFLRDRLSAGDSIVLVAEHAGRKLCGFAQLYPSFSSVRAARIYILNDLFVAASARRRGVGSALLQSAVAAARAERAALVKLSTAITNVAAQRLYESHGWKRDEHFYEYGLAL